MRSSAEVAACNQRGQPVLVGTTDHLEASEHHESKCSVGVI